MLQTQVNGSGKNSEFQRQHRQRTATSGRLPIQDFRQAMLLEMLTITRYRKQRSAAIPFLMVLMELEKKTA